MATKKTVKAKSKRADSVNAANVSQQVQEVLKKVKVKYNSLDQDTKKKIVASLATIAALLAARVTVKKIKKGKD